MTYAWRVGGSVKMRLSGRCVVAAWGQVVYTHGGLTMQAGRAELWRGGFRKDEFYESVDSFILSARPGFEQALEALHQDALRLRGDVR